MGETFQSFFHQRIQGQPQQYTFNHLLLPLRKSIPRHWWPQTQPLVHSVHSVMMGQSIFGRVVDGRAEWNQFPMQKPSVLEGTGQGLT